MDLPQAFPSGPVSGDLVARLSALAEKPVNLTRGFHLCPFCLAQARSEFSMDDGGKALLDSLRGLGAMGNGEILVRGEEGVCYLAPVLVSHYVELHGYQPPREFVVAVERG
ncbi:hypothetical protein O7600_13350 [Micromonospora sp. WMMA1998]|uniref:DUF7919 family protein n=1 Tax=Micromonospora sp. WMMA1998 TaxID=3015167 RepID=UPI00248AECAA|nr:hypothetical protein [Micromonospora sp. WMMA1998]WBC17744.1 hypothetical protein O7600_13350 [Micromonospora sp. WMMA1998]